MKTSTEFWDFAYDAIKIGLITKQEALTIVRPGTRKQNYWARHYRDLTALVQQRLDERRVSDASGRDNDHAED